ncbi:MAG: hypothetical protein NVS4B3_08050 [Gemmatimonadaceae bacterium]
MLQSAQLAGAALLALALPARAQQEPTPTYRIVGRIMPGGEGGWDYLTVDPIARRLYVSRSTHVMVLDIDRDSVVGDLPNTPGVHGAAVASGLGRGFTSNGRDSTVTMFDLKTLAPLATIKVTGRNPDAIVYDPASNRVFAFNGGSANATAIDAATGAIVGTIDLGGRPEFATSDSAGTMFVNLEDRSAVVAFDSRSLAVRGRWPLAGCEEPSGMAIDRANHRLFIGCANKRMEVVNASTGAIVATLPIGSGVDANAFDPILHVAFSSNGDGTLTVVRQSGGDNYTVADNVVTKRGARTLALDEQTHKIYLATADFSPPPAPTAAVPHPRPPMVPGSFQILIVAPR